MGFFSHEYLEFFDQLKDHNDTDWFDEHRDFYVEHVREPFKTFTQLLALKIQEFDEHVDPSPHRYRINYNRRFYPDRPPYKLFKSASFHVGSWKSQVPSYYIEFGADYIMVGGGMYRLDAQKKDMVREHIAWHHEEFVRLQHDQIFQDTYGGIKGELNKRIPKEYRKIAEDVPALYHKQFYYTTDLPAELLLSQQLMNKIAEHLEIIAPLNKFFRQAFVA